MSNIDVSNPEESDPCTVLCRPCCVQMAASTTHGMNSNILNSWGRVLLETLHVPQLSTNPPLIPTVRPSVVTFVGNVMNTGRKNGEYILIE
jgi:hypothetical protein